MMACTLFPAEAHHRQYLDQAHTILDQMIGRGNRIARARKNELNCLDKLCDEFVNQTDQRGFQTLILAQDNLHLAQRLAARDQADETHPGATASVDSVGEFPVTDPALYVAPTTTHEEAVEAFDLLVDIGISSGDVFDIVDQMGDIDYMMHDFTNHPGHDGESF